MEVMEIEGLWFETEVKIAMMSAINAGEI